MYIPNVEVFLFALIAKAAIVVEEKCTNNHDLIVSYSNLKLRLFAMQYFVIYFIYDFW